MLEKTLTPAEKEARPSSFDKLAALDLLVEDDTPPDSPWHRMAMNLLISLLHFFWRERDDFYVGGNMFIHFDLAMTQRRAFRGPDFFVVEDVDGQRVAVMAGHVAGRNDGVEDAWLRFYDPGGNLVLTREKTAEARAAELAEELERLRASRDTD